MITRGLSWEPESARMTFRERCPVRMFFFVYLFIFLLEYDARDWSIIQLIQAQVILLIWAQETPLSNKYNDLDNKNLIKFSFFYFTNRLELHICWVNEWMSTYTKLQENSQKHWDWEVNQLLFFYSQGKSHLSVILYLFEITLAPVTADLCRDLRWLLDSNGFIGKSVSKTKAHGHLNSWSVCPLEGYCLATVNPHCQGIC